MEEEEGGEEGENLIREQSLVARKERRKMG